MMVTTEEKIIWVKVLRTEDVHQDEGVCVKVNSEQIAIFRFSSRQEWYATSNMCPHKMQMILYRGFTGDKSGEPKVVCPFHKKSFSLKSGACLSGDEYSIKTYPIKVEKGDVYVGIE